MRKLDPANLKLAGSLFVLVFLIASIAIIVRYLPQQRGTQPRAAESKTINGYTSALTWDKSSYPPDSSGGNCVTYVHNLVGQDFGSSKYYANRTYAVWYTEGIPDNATVISAALDIELDGINWGGIPYDHTATDFTLNIRGKPGGYDPGMFSIGCEDWQSSFSGYVLAGTYWTGNLPNLSPGQIAHISIPLNNDSSYSWINKLANSGVVLSSNREEANNQPAGQEWFEIYNSSLVVNYTTPSPPTPPFCGDKSCNNGETCSSCPADCGVCPSQPGGGGTTPGGGGKQPGGGTKTGGAGALNTLQLTISVPYLVGNMKIPVKIGSFSKDIEVSPDKKDYSLEVKEANISLGNPVSVVVGGNKTLIKKIQVAPSTETTAVNVGDLTLGDITGDNKIDDKDAVSFLDSITKQTLKGDLNADKATNSLDWAILLANFGKSGDL